MLRALGIDWLDLLFLAVILAAALAYWWARKAARHPDYAARKEAAVDQGVAAALRAAGVSEDVIAKLTCVGLVAQGQRLYTEADALADQLESKAKQLLAHVKVLRDRAR